MFLRRTCRYQRSTVFLLAWVVVISVVAYLQMYSTPIKAPQEVKLRQVTSIEYAQLAAEPTTTVPDEIPDIPTSLGGILPESALTENVPIGKDKEPRLILMWNAFFGDSIDQRNLNGCPEYNCKLINDKSQFSRSHAIIFHMGDANGANGRQPWQRFVYFVQESPLHSGAGGAPGVFNWTLSYRRDSDMPSPYGYTIKLTKPLVNLDEFNLTKLVQGKKKMGAWFVSNCGATSGRQNYIRALQDLNITIDVFGACGKMQCPKSNEHQCEQLLENDYKFYFALENSICRDYITEKYWHKATLRIVPIVFKRHLIERYVPPESFIAVDDFHSPKEMAEYLRKLDADDEAYLSYFRWRLKYKIIFLNGRVHDALEKPWGFCLLCKKIWTEEQTHTAYDDLRAWWVTHAHCESTLVNEQLSYREGGNVATPAVNSSVRVTAH